MKPIRPSTKTRAQKALKAIIRIYSPQPRSCGYRVPYFTDHHFYRIYELAKKGLGQ